MPQDALCAICPKQAREECLEHSSFITNRKSSQVSLESCPRPALRLITAEQADMGRVWFGHIVLQKLQDRVSNSSVFFGWFRSFSFSFSSLYLIYSGVHVSHSVRSSSTNLCRETAACPMGDGQMIDLLSVSMWQAPDLWNMASGNKICTDLGVFILYTEFTSCSIVAQYCTTSSHNILNQWLCKTCLYNKVTWLCMYSPCLCGFPPGPLVSSMFPKIITNP